MLRAEAGPFRPDVRAALRGSCEVLLGGLEVMADIGALESERGVPQPLLVHVAAEVVPPATDDLAGTFDYARIRAAARRLAEQRIVLIETFAYALALACLECDAVLAVEVRVDKPGAIPGCLAGARVRLGRAAE